MQNLQNLKTITSPISFSDCLCVMVPRLYWCDCELIDNLPNVNVGAEEYEEVESLHHR